MSFENSNSSVSSLQVTNRRGTMSKAKSFRRPALNLDSVNNNSGSNSLTYRFLNGEEYLGPDISIVSPPTTPRTIPSSVNIESNDYKVPVFLGVNGAIYNKYYIAIKIVGIPDDKPNTFKEPYFQFNSLDPIYSKFPEYLEFDNYYDYEQALVDWKLQVQKNLGVLQLPHTVGRTYNRPKAYNDRFLRKNSEASNDDSFSFETERKLTDSDINNSSNSGTTNPNNNNNEDESNQNDSNTITTHTGTSLENKNHILGDHGRDRSGSDTSTGSYDGQLDGTSPVDGSPSNGGLVNFIANGGTRSRSNSSTYLEHRVNRGNLSPKQVLQRLGDSSEFKRSMGGVEEERWILNKDPWDSQLILPEPEPELYNTYEEYEFALRNWSVEVVSKTSVIPPHASQFIQMPANGKLTDSTDGNSNGPSQTSSPSKNKSLKLEIESILKSPSENDQDWVVRSGILPIESEDDFHMDTLDKNSKLVLYDYDSHHFYQLDANQIPKQPPASPWRKFENTLKYEIGEIFDRSYRKRLQVYKLNLLASSCSYWSHRLVMMHMYRSWRESLNRKSSFLPNLPIRAARRKDLESETDGGKVEVNYPIPEFQIQFSKLQTTNMNLQHILGMFDQTLNQGNDPNAPNSATSNSTITSSTGSPIQSNQSPSTPSKSSISTPPSLLSTKDTLAGTSTRSLDPQEEKKQYQTILQQYDKRLIYSFRYDQLNSWYDENKYKNHIKEIEHYSNLSHFDMNSVWSMVTNNQFPLDKFQEFIGDLDFKLYVSNLPSLNLLNSPNSSSNGLNRLASSSQNFVTSPSLQHQMIGSPPSRSGSTGSFSFGSPLSNSNKLPLSPSHSNSVLSSGMESPRSQSHLNSSSSSFVNSTLGTSTAQSNSSPRSQINSSSANLLANSSSTSITNNNVGGSKGDNNSSTVAVSLINAQFISSFINNIISTDSFPVLLSFLDKASSALTRSKISSLVILSLISESKSAILFESILLSKDIPSLFKMAEAISFFDAVPLDLFPYPNHLNEMLTLNIMQQGSLLEVVKLVFMYYYLQIIQERLPHHLSNNNNTIGSILGSNTSNSATNNSILNQFPSLKRDTSERIAIYLQNDKDLVRKIFQAINKKSKFISHSFLFVLIQLLKMESSSVQVQLKSKDSMIVNLIRDLSHSKFLHCKFAARRLYTILQDDYKDFLLADYYDPSNIDKDSSPLLTDLLTPDNYRETEGSLISDLVYHLSTNTLTHFIQHPFMNSSPTSSSSGNSGSNNNLLSLSSKQPIFKFILNETIFYQIYNSLVKSKKHDQCMENLSSLFALLCKTLYKSNLIRKTDTVKMKKKEDNQNEIQVTPICLFDILTFLGNQNLNDKYSPVIKTNMLISLRHLLKSPDLFDVLKKEERFYNKLLIPSCRDNRNSDFNRNSWRLFYQIIRFHSGHLEFLEKGKYLIQIMDIISLNSGNVVINHALHYLAKLFSLVVYETKKKSDSSTIKHIEKDIKSLISFFNDRHLFIKLHMIYKRFSENKTFPGFIKLATLYQVIITLPICSKLAKDTMKNPEFKEGIHQISKLFKLEENTSK